MVWSWPLDLPCGQRENPNDLIFKTCESPIFPRAQKDFGFLTLVEIKWKALVLGMDLEALLALAWAGQAAGRGVRCCPHPTLVSTLAAGPPALHTC